MSHWIEEWTYATGRCTASLSLIRVRLSVFVLSGSFPLVPFPFFSSPWFSFFLVLYPLVFHSAGSHLSGFLFPWFSFPMLLFPIVIFLPMQCPEHALLPGHWSTHLCVHNRNLFTVYFISQTRSNLVQLLRTNISVLQKFKTDNIVRGIVNNRQQVDVQISCHFDDIVHPRAWPCPSLPRFRWLPHRVPILDRLSGINSSYHY